MSVGVIVLICICSACILGIIGGIIVKAHENWYGSLASILTLSILCWYFAGVGTWKKETIRIYPKIQHDKVNKIVTATYDYDSETHKQDLDFPFDTLTTDLEWYLDVEINFCGVEIECDLRIQKPSDFETLDYSIKDKKIKNEVENESKNNIIKIN